MKRYFFFYSLHMLQVPFFSCLGTPHPFLFPAFPAVTPRGEGRPAWPESTYSSSPLRTEAMELSVLHVAVHGVLGRWYPGTFAADWGCPSHQSYWSGRRRLSGLCRCSAAKTWSRLVLLSRVPWAPEAALRALRNLCARGRTAPFPSQKIPVLYDARCSYSCFEEAGVGPVRLQFFVQTFCW